MGDFDEICESLDVPKKVKEKAEDLYKSFEEFSWRGYKKVGVSATSFYAACRKMGIPRSYKEVADAFEIDKEIIVRNLRLLSEKINLQLPLYNPYDCTTYLIEKLDLPESVGNKTKQILERMERKNLVTGRNPFGVSAATIQIACSSIGVEMHQKEIADASTVSTVTVQSIRAEIKNKLNLNCS